MSNFLTFVTTEENSLTAYTLAMAQKFNSKKFAKAILDKRTREGLTFRAIQKSTKDRITGGTLCRLEAETQLPNAETLADVCNWLGLPVQTFYDNSKL